MIAAFPPVADERSRTLVLGSMPGVASLTKRQYYGHPRNHFWPIVYGVFDGGAPSPDYEERLAFAAAHGIALWDVLCECEREGSLDSAIRSPVANDFNAFLELYPGITRIFFNGSAAAQLFTRHVDLAAPHQTRLTLEGLPSTSPAHTISYERKLAAWQAIRQPE
ncbi:DNA-deoxyinosine glycosylase [Paenibacillus thalictri]|uniref:DNA-deoxyinosine glycosylase n=2 Tax=Paenibacillus thalictri TaxID=2527873 RepID=A0A4Q9DLG1_9BACL|nr:DNA-deoxyinosine glycosylase [Paenibacillus thalictri]